CTWNGYTLSSCPSDWNCTSDTCGGTTKYAKTTPKCTWSGYTLASCPSNGICNQSEECGGIRKYSHIACETGYGYWSNSTGTGCTDCSYRFEAKPYNGLTTYKYDNCPSGCNCSDYTCGGITKYAVQSVPNGYLLSGDQCVLDTRCLAGRLVYSDKTCSVDSVSGKTPIGVLVSDDGLIAATGASSDKVKWSSDTYKTCEKKVTGALHWFLPTTTQAKKALSSCGYFSSIKQGAVGTAKNLLNNLCLANGSSRDIWTTSSNTACHVYSNGGVDSGKCETKTYAAGYVFCMADMNTGWMTGAERECVVSGGTWISDTSTCSQLGATRYGDMVIIEETESSYKLIADVFVGVLAGYNLEEGDSETEAYWNAYTYTYDDAVEGISKVWPGSDYCDNKDICGPGKYRLPTVDELQAISNNDELYKKSIGHLNTNLIWTSTPAEDGKMKVWSPAGRTSKSEDKSNSEDIFVVPILEVPK
ncbi:MAG: hypothetical protein IJ545_02410, partial [Alphaproteobacteria bacterium]|nr:hypothetical protein [Alphaproteobacteria bacterium]